jgi:hypothetical protein
MLWFIQWIEAQVQFLDNGILFLQGQESYINVMFIRKLPSFSYVPALQQVVPGKGYPDDNSGVPGFAIDYFVRELWQEVDYHSEDHFHSNPAIPSQYSLTDRLDPSRSLSKCMEKPF